ncbi:aldehyde dehydrogenase family protein [Rhizobium leucaenae]|uniref:aldehyde dehydrogenase family protein n=1 Tax=Rhizobium leucaenae TaxID=29450 RepID=UPI001858020E|nr:acyl-CoA reductase-like NAD-dependent aldehyde dehydrogenase [Rhizobium leucaenae]
MISGQIEIRSPYDDSVVGTVTAATASDVERALSTAYALFQDRRGWLPKQLRVAVLRRAAEIVAERRETIARLAAQEGGKPLKDSLIEVDRGVEGIRACVEELHSNAGHVVPMAINAISNGKVAYTQYEPIGVVVGVSAFNHPFNLVVHQIAPAVAVGAPIIIKPATQTPLSCRMLLDILSEAGLPDGWAQMVLPGEVELATKLATDPRVGFLSFVGSSKVGWMLRSKLAPGTRCALEHGGAAPVIVSQDADLATALPRLARGAFFHAGQACVSVQRVFCHHSIAVEVAAGLADLGNRMAIGDPLLMTTDIGPLISSSEVDRIDRWVGEAVHRGAALISGARKRPNNCYENTVLFNPPADAAVMRNEIFGPVVCVCGYDDIDDAISVANDLPFAFQAAVFTQTIDTALHCCRHLNATAVMVNDSTLFRIDGMPFAGARSSGLGVGGIPFTMRDMQTEKMIVWQSNALS